MNMPFFRLPAIVLMFSSIYIAYAIGTNVSRAVEETSPKPVFKFVDEVPKSDAKSSNEERFRAALLRRVTFESEQTIAVEILAAMNDACDFAVAGDGGNEGHLLKHTFQPPNFRTPVTFAAFLNHLSTASGLKWTWSDETLMFRGEDRFDVVKRYAIEDLLQTSPFFQDARSTRVDVRTPSETDRLIEMLQGTVDSNTWKSNGGQGDVMPFGTPTVIIVTTSYPTHLRVEALLNDLRKRPRVDPWTRLAGPGVKPDQAVALAYHLFLPERVISSTSETREDPAKHLNEKPTPIVNHSLKFERTMTAEQVAQIVRKTVTPTAWDGTAKIEAIGDMLMIVHDRAGHESVSKLLLQLGLNQPSQESQSLR